MKKFFMFVGIITCTLFTNTATATKTTESTVYITCPGGFFCTSNGQYYTTSTNTTNFWGNTTVENKEIPPYMYGPAELVTPGWGMFSSEGFCAECNGEYNGTCIHCADDYDEAWVSIWFGFYGAKNGEVTYYSWKNAGFSGVFPCPGTYPSSDSGASSIFQCYRITSNNEKEYYKTPNNTHHSYDGNYNTDDVNAILINLQSALSQANSAAQNLESILKKSNNKIHIHRSNLVAIQADATIATQALDNIKTTNTTANNPTTTTQPTNTPTATTPPTIKLTETKSDSTTTSPLKKLDFGNLSSIFSVDKAAVHTQTQGRTTIPTKNTRIKNTDKTQPIRSKQKNISQNTRSTQNTNNKIKHSANYQNTKSISHRF